MSALSQAMAKDPNAYELVRQWNGNFSRTRRADTRHTIRNHNLRCNPKGKGNRAWKRADALERAFRADGGFYLSDLFPWGSAIGLFSNKRQP